MSPTLFGLVPQAETFKREEIINMFENKYVKIAILAAAVVLMVVVIILAFGRDSALFPDRGEVTTVETEQTTVKELGTYPPFDDSNVGEWH